MAAKRVRYSPQLAVLVDRPPEGTEWLHEIKYDGYRTIAVIENQKAQFFTRNGLDWTDRYSALRAVVKKLKVKSAVFDGEVAALDDQGRTDFGKLQAALKNGKTTDLVYYVFDCLELNGRDLRDLPLEKRKAELRKILKPADHSAWIYSEDFESPQLLRQACKAGLEGVISKLKSAPYDEGRSDVWRKSKCGHEQEFVIAGYTPPSGARERIGALLLAVREGQKLRYVGKVGTGFSSATLRELHKKFESAISGDSPFVRSVPDEKRATWLKPKFVAQIRFGGWTPDQHIRHGVYLGLREDKAAKDVVAEKPKRVSAKHKISHPQRRVFAQVTKNDLALYYEKIAPRMLNFIDGRPLSLLRCPGGVQDQCFFQKHLDGQDTIAAQSADELVQFVQLGAIEVHAANVRLKRPDNPDMIVFDLDPGPKVSWAQVIEGAFSLKETLDHVGLRSFVKLSGGKGVHIHVAIAPKYSYAEVRAFSKAVVEDLARREPHLYLIKMTKSARNGRIFLDYFRNNEGATAVAPYSVRARGRGSIALPIPWSSLKPDLLPDAILVEDFKKLPPDPWRGLQSDQTIAILEQKGESKSRSSF